MLGAQQASELGPPLSEQALRNRLSAVAADSMRGRAAGLPGNNLATAYVAREFAAAGLQPAGEKGTFFQELPLVRRVFDSTSALVVNGRRLTPFTDYLPRDGGGDAPALDGKVVAFAGRWTDSVTLIPASAAVDRMVVIDASTAGFDIGLARARYPDAAAIAIANLDRMSGGLRETFARLDRLIHLDTTKTRRATPALLHVGTELASELLGQPLATAHPGDRGATVRGIISFRTVKTPARNVVAVLRGSDPRRRGEYVVIAAHNDHLGVTSYVKDVDSLRAFNLAVRQRVIEIPASVASRALDSITAGVRVNMDSLRATRPRPRLDSIYRGADDDGSGTVALLEIARALGAARTKPRRSIVFISHTAEEMGDLGSKWFVAHPTRPLDSMVAMVNLDMIGRGGAQDERGGGPRYLALVGTRRLSSELGDLIERVSRDGAWDWEFDYSYDARGHPEQVYCRSDHASYAMQGIPVAFFFTGYHADYHQLTDNPEYIDYTKLAKVARFTSEVATTIADLDHRVVVERPVRSPGQACRQ
jgi:hypothetical protein